MAIIQLRRFNDEGMAAFKDYLEATRENERNTNGIRVSFPPLPYDNKLTEILDNNIQLDDSKKFQDRYEMAHYLKRQLGSHFKTNDNFEMWAWIAAIFFEQFIRTIPVKKMVTSRFEHFIPFDYIERNYPDLLSIPRNLNYRHCVMTPSYLIENYEDVWCKYLLKDRMNNMGDPIEHTFSNKAILKSKKLRKVILELYQDKTTFLAKPGCYSSSKESGKSNAGKGGVRRFNLIRDRTKKSYDIEVMDVKTIISKMGKEINTSKWVKQQT